MWLWEDESGEEITVEAEIRKVCECQLGHCFHTTQALPRANGDRQIRCCKCHHVTYGRPISKEEE